MAEQLLTEIKGVPLRGGAVTRVPKGLLPSGAFPWIQNMRQRHPGLRKRRGQRKLHTVTDDQNSVLTLYQFEKSRVTESVFLAQMSDGDVLQATSDPPTVTTGAFGSEVFSGSAGQIPASWGNVDDLLLFSNGVDQHKLFSGSSSYVEKFVVFKGSAAPPDVPDSGMDYTDVVAGVSGSAVLDSLNTYANHHCFFVKSPIRATGFTFTVSSPNGNTAALGCYYRASDNTWTQVSNGSDGTASGGACLAQSGTFTFDAPSDEIPHYQYGSSGWWYQFRVDAQLDAEVRVSAVSFTGDWQDLENVWDGIPVDAIEVWAEGTDQWFTYSSAAVDLSSFASGNRIIIFSTDPLCGIFWDVGSTPNSTGTALTAVKYTTGDGTFTSVGSVSDETAGLSNSGWMTFPRQSDVMPVQFEGARFYAYVYEVTFDTDLAVDTQVGIVLMPYFDIEDYGKSRCNCVWQDRAAYSFTLWPQYIYISAAHAPTVLNGVDYGIIEAGDGRSNKITAMSRFYNEMIVWQEEKGREGGCTTLIQGYSPATFGKLVLSSRIGAMNAKSVAVVDGVLTATATDEQIKTLAFWISRYGICATDGRTVHVVSDDIADYFDPQEDHCIRRGYEDEHWLEYDSAENVLRVGLVTGDTATKPNTFLVFDLVDKSWSFDVLGQNLSCMTEVTAGSGDSPVVQVGGGTADGFVYQLNYGTDDVNAVINSYLEIIFNEGGLYMTLTEFLLRCTAEDYGHVLLTVTGNGILTDVEDLSLDIVGERQGQLIRRNRINLNVEDQLLVLKLQNEGRNQDVEILDMGLELRAWVGR